MICGRSCRVWQQLPLDSEAAHVQPVLWVSARVPCWNSKLRFLLAICSSCKCFAMQNCVTLHRTSLCRMDAE
jgi:hypothetical protein